MCVFVEMHTNIFALSEKDKRLVFTDAYKNRIFGITASKIYFKWEKVFLFRDLKAPKGIIFCFFCWLIGHLLRSLHFSVQVLAESQQKCWWKTEETPLQRKILGTVIL